MMPHAVSRPAAAPSAKLGTLELGRFLAASIVVLTHWLPDVNTHAAHAGQTVFAGWHAPGAIGVQYFFVLSGFVMASAHLGDFGRLTAPLRFWWRRACRIYPSYWLALVIPIHYLSGFLTPAFSLQLFTLSPWHDGDFIAPAWSLRYEIAFYTIFGLCLLPWLGRPLLAAWILLTLWRWAPGPALALLHLPPPFLVNELATRYGDRFTSFMDIYFFAGLAAGYGFARLRGAGAVISTALTGAGAVLSLVMLSRLGWGDQYGAPGTQVPLMACGLAMLLLGLAGLERHGWLRLGRWAERAGALSYPLYILHAPLLLAWDQFSRALKLSLLDLYGLSFVGLLTLYLAAAAVTFWYDQPLQRQFRRLGRGTALAIAARRA